MSFGLSPVNAEAPFLPLEFQAEGDYEFFRELISQRQRLVSSIVNIKENAYYDTQELLTAQQFFSITVAPQPKITRYTFRKVINFGPLPGVASTQIIPHGITGINSNWIFTRIYAIATNPTAAGANTKKFIPIPYASAGSTDNIELFVTDTNVEIKVSTANWGGFTTCYVILEYIKG